jgi:hypothetical protein
MKKNVLLPYDRYQRLMNEPLQSHELVSTDNAASTPNKTDLQNAHQANAHSDISTIVPGSPSETLVQRFPKSMQSRAKSVLDYIQPHITWNEKGEVSIKGREFPGSNIIDLVKVHVKDYKHFDPIGKSAFRAVLTDLNVPTSLLSASVRQQTGEGQLPPPPGIQVKRRGDISDPPAKKKTKWLRL